VANVQTGAYRDWVQTQYAQEASAAAVTGATA
jgi:dTDP-glucose 4,6-dehydratase